jgi:hypothetical protein
MSRMVDVIAARLVEGSLVPYLGPALLRAPPFPAGSVALAEWLAARSPVPGHAIGHLEATAGWIEVQRGRRTLVKLLREAFAAHAEPDPLHLLLAGLPSLPLTVAPWYDATWCDVLVGAAQAGGRSVALVHGLSPQDGRGVFFTAPEAPGLTPPAQAETVLYQPLGTCHPVASFLASEADLADLRLALETQAPVPPDVQRRRDGCGFLFVGCTFEDALERQVARGTMRGAPGPHFAVLPRPPVGVLRTFLSESGIIPLELTGQRFVAELSRRLARPAAPRPADGPAASLGGAP